MQFSTIRSKAVAVPAALVVAGAGLVGVAATADDAAPARGEVPAMDAPAYAGDPWETRFREQFWSTQHIHDSWNRCHLGENVPPGLRSPGC